MVADIDRGLNELYEVGWKWHDPSNYAVDELDFLVRTLREHDKAGRLSSRASAWVQFWHAILEIEYDDFASAQKRLESINLEHADTLLAAERSLRLGKEYLRNHDGSKATPCYLDALKLFRQLKHPRGEAHSLKALGDIERYHQNFAKAHELYLEAIEHYRAINEKEGIVNCIKALGDIERFFGLLDDALGRYEEALSMYRAIGADWGVTNTIQAMAHIDSIRGAYDIAEISYTIAKKAYESEKDRLGMANASKALGDLYRKQGKLDRALRLLFNARDLYKQVGSGIKWGEANSLLSIGEAYLAQNDPSEALRFFQRAESIYVARNDLNGQARLAFAFAHYHRMNGQLRLARASTIQSLDFYAKKLMRIEVGETTLLLGVLARDEGRTKIAVYHFTRALRLLSSVNTSDVNDAKEWLKSQRVLT